ncbi:hypothetical protein ASF63_15750 [Microbacterium sp. Leaf320]|nr:hypothetical protein ASF63_15750 [Microbacterium sp. Leaf320]
MSANGTLTIKDTKADGRTAYAQITYGSQAGVGFETREVFNRLGSGKTLTVAMPTGQHRPTYIRACVTVPNWFDSCSARKSL